MKMNILGRTDISVSEICLGTMTWGGNQNTEAEGHEQMDYAVEHGVNFFDTAEMYSVNPVAQHTQGNTERIVGTWFEKSGKRDEIVLATKVMGGGVKWIRDGGIPTRETIGEAIEASLQRMKTDYIDLYQVHWPTRGSIAFRQNWGFDATGQDKDKTIDEIHDILRGLEDAVKAGKVRAVGLSNETTWGTMQYLRLAKEHNLPRVATIQNEYSLLYRHYDLDLAEMSHHEDIGLLPYSPLATGILTGKYQNGEIPEGSRRSIEASLGGRFTARSEKATAKYLDLAKAHGLDPSQMAIAFCNSRAFVPSTIIGATKMDQLKTCIGAGGMSLSDEVLSGIDDINRHMPWTY
ncbi:MULTISPECIES: aldo/keto reductase [unclassified Lentilitoribacter]|uniref:aldo/keto reductase n=1 Tax=unclassified Lentilitoribacter TaxID=2647570 RepID=UPI0013A6B5ED|nr:aldo/keto reductase [Lentilitoribacter sp. Alg239-R112]